MCGVVPEKQRTAVRTAHHPAVADTPQVSVGQNTMKVLVILAVKVDYSFVNAVEEQCIGEISYMLATLDDVNYILIVGSLLQLIQVIFGKNFVVE